MYYNLWSNGQELDPCSVRSWVRVFPYHDTIPPLKWRVLLVVLDWGPGLSGYWWWKSSNEHDHWSHYLLVPNYARWEYILANRPNSRACCEQCWTGGWRQLRTQVHLQVRSGVEVVWYDLGQCYPDRVLEENYEIPDVFVVATVDRDEKRHCDSLYSVFRSTLEVSRMF